MIIFEAILENGTRKLLTSAQVRQGIRPRVGLGLEARKGFIHALCGWMYRNGYQALNQVTVGTDLDGNPLGFEKVWIVTNGLVRVARTGGKMGAV